MLLYCVFFNGEVFDNEINCVVVVVKEKNSDFIIGFGGGKIIDFVKVIVDKVNLLVVIVLIVVLIDVLILVLLVIYIDEGVFEKYIFYLKNLDLVLVDI